MRSFIWPLVMVVLLLLQGVTSVFYTGWLCADLLQLLVYSMATIYGSQWGAVAGLAAGLLQDAMSVGLFGLHMLVLMALGALVGSTRNKLVHTNYSYHMLLAVLCTVFIRSCFFIVQLIAGGSWKIWGSYLQQSVGYCLGNMLLVVPVYMLTQIVSQWISEVEITYEDEREK